jgi:hypothetical protein
MFTGNVVNSSLFLLIAICGISAALVISCLIHNRIVIRKHAVRELPGPALVPLIGRIHDLPRKYVWLKFKEWSDIYGKIYRTKMLSARVIVVSDEQVAEELLVRRAKINSDRPAIKSLFDSKSTYGSMEYLPLMGHNSKLFPVPHQCEAPLIKSRILVAPATLGTCHAYRSVCLTMVWNCRLRGEALALSSDCRAGDLLRDTRGYGF